MKTLVLLTLFFCATLGDVLYNPEQVALIQGAMKECKEITQIKRQLILNILNKQVPHETKVKDFLFCVYKKTHFIKEDGTVNKIVVQTFADTLIPPAKTALHHCIDTLTSTPQEESTGPETAYLLAKCYLESLPSDLTINFVI